MNLFYSPKSPKKAHQLVLPTYMVCIMNLPCTYLGNPIALSSDACKALFCSGRLSI